MKPDTGTYSPVPTSAFVVDASVVVRWLVDGPFSAECRTFLQQCGARDARLLAPSCLYSEVANALYRLCLARPPVPVLAQDEAVDFLQSLPDYGIALVDYVRRLPSGDIALVPQWEQLTDGAVRDYRIAIYAQGLVWSSPRRQGSLFDISYAALAEQAGTTMWTIDERFYNGARAQSAGAPPSISRPIHRGGSLRRHGLCDSHLRGRQHTT